MKRVTRLSETRRAVFLPEGYPKAVRPSYLKFTLYNAVSQVASSALGVLSTQQLLLGLGLNSLSASAALNWIMKDGIGQLGGVAFASYVGTRFDSNARYYRLVSSVSLNVSCAIEMVSPLLPGWFLPIAALATTGKNVSCLAGSASKAAIHQHFALENNLGDVTVKTGNQNSFTGLIGMTIGTFLAYSFQPWVIPLFVGLSAIHIGTVYQSVKLVDFNTLNITRAEILVDNFIKTACILSPQEVAAHESLVTLKPDISVIVGSPEGLEAIPAQYCKPYYIARVGAWTYLALEENCTDDQALIGLVEAFMEHKHPSTPLDVSTFILALAPAGWQLHSSHFDLGSVRYKVSQGLS